MTSVLILLSGFGPGTYTIEDDGDPTNGIAQLRQPDGSVIFFNIPTEFLTVTASAGRSVIINLPEWNGAADINVGSLTNTAENPDSITVGTINGAGDVLLASNSSITELGSDPTTDIKAATLIMSAVTGIGTPGNALETQVGTLEAETDTGGINLSNAGNVTIGGLTDDVNGLLVATSGDLTFVNAGGIDVNEETGFESIRGGNTSGDVTLTANGFDSDIRSLVDIDFAAAPGGDVTLTAGRDVSLGTQGLNFDNDVRARDNLIIHAGRDLNIDGFADLASDGFGAVSGGNVVVNAGRDINVLNSTGTDASIGAEGSGGGDVILNAGEGGFVRLLASSASVLFSSTGNVTANTDRMVIAATAGITATSGTVTLRPRTEGWTIDLGSGTDGAFALEISDAEADRIFTQQLNIGSVASGVITASAAFGPAAATNLQLTSGTDIRLTSALTVLNEFTLRAGNDVFVLAGSATTAADLTVFVDQLGSDGGTGGRTFFDGAATVGTPRIFGNGDADTLRGTGGGDTIDGQEGADTMSGVLGDDTYIVDNVNDVVIEAIGEGTDLVSARVSYVLAAGVFVERLATTSNAGTAAINLTGNELVQEITGNAGNNRLDGGAGADTLIGLAGNDTLIVDNANDVVIETFGQGTDRVGASVSYVLGGGQHVERMSTTNSGGTGAINLTGNELVQEITGNAGNNRLDGSGGADTLIGGAGNDTLIVDNAADIVIEGLNGGTDRIGASVSYALAAGQHVERMSTTNSVGTTSIHLTGNEFAQELTGNYANNWLTGAGGRDVMTGSLGNDTFDFNAVSDSGTGASTRDVIMDFTDTGGEQDKINVATIDANTTVAGNQAFVLDLNGSFSTGEIRQTLINGGTDLLLEFNNDADASADTSILLDGRTSLLNNADFTF